MNRLQYLLIKLAEECSEVSQMALKCAHHGISNVKPEHTSPNSEMLKGELNDVQAIIEMLNREFNLNYYPDPQALLAKTIKVNTFYGYSKANGHVE